MRYLEASPVSVAARGGSMRTSTASTPRAGVNRVDPDSGARGRLCDLLARVLGVFASPAEMSSENRRLSADLQDRESRVRRLFNANIIGIFNWKLDGRIVDANEAFLKIVGYDSEDVISGRMRWTDLMPGEWDPADDLIMDEMLATGIAPTFEAEYVRKDGSRVPVLIGAAIFDGIPKEGVAFVVDLTDRKQAEALAREREHQYRESQMALEHANRVATLGQLSASIAHELAQPLAGVVINSQSAQLMLARAEPGVADAQRTLERIVRDGERAQEVLGRIRTLIKKAPPQREELAINDVVLEIVDLTRGEAAQSGVEIRTRLGAELPLIVGDRVQLQQVILNLTMNAIDAIGGVKDGPRDILIRADKDDAGGLHVRVQDSGPGIDPAQAGRIFEAFYTTKDAGLGMGLSICRSIIESHGGKLWAAPNEPRGAVFQFTVPVNGE